MFSLAAALPYLEVDPNSVRAGWLPLGIVVLLFLLIIGLYFSLRHEIKKIQVPYRAEVGDAAASGTEAGAATGRDAE